MGKTNLHIKLQKKKMNHNTRDKLGKEKGDDKQQNNSRGYNYYFYHFFCRIATISIWFVYFFYKNDNNKPELDNLSSTVLVFLKLLFFPTSFLSATEKINNKNLVHFNILAQFSVPYLLTYSQQEIAICTNGRHLQPIHLSHFFLLIYNCSLLI